MIKPLLVRPSPRANIPEVEQYQSVLPWDQYIPKFYTEPEAYELARNFFLDHREYSHMVICADDVVVKMSHCIKLQQDLEMFDYPVLSGVINVYQEDLETLNITPEGDIPHPKWELRKHNWMKKKDAFGIIQVGFSGFPLMAIRRDIIEQIPFESEAKYNNIPEPLGGSFDVMFCYRCHQNLVPIFADCNINMLHLRTSGTHRVGTAKPEIVFRTPFDKCLNNQIHE